MNALSVAAISLLEDLIPMLDYGSNTMACEEHRISSSLFFVVYQLVFSLQLFLIDIPVMFLCLHQTALSSLWLLHADACRKWLMLITFWLENSSG